MPCFRPSRHVQAPKIGLSGGDPGGNDANTHVLLREMSSRVQRRIVAVAKKHSFPHLMSTRPVCFCQHLKKYRALCGEENSTDQPNLFAAAIRVTMQQQTMSFSELKHRQKDRQTYCSDLLSATEVRLHLELWITKE